MAMALVYYNPLVVTHDDQHSLPGIEKFSYFFRKLFGPTMVVIDRSHIISIPVQVKALSSIPLMRPFHATFEDICNRRALELLKRADAADSQVYVSWSGGIDSTLVLVSLLKNATAAQKKRIIVLLSEESIAENPRFYREHIRGALHCEASVMFPYVLGTRHLFVSGELNDQIFGAAAPGDLMIKFGDAIVHKPYSRDVLFNYYRQKIDSADIVNFYLDLFEKVVRAAPVPIVTYFDYFWWINFTLKWQSVALRVLSFTAERNSAGVTAHYLENNFAPFYGTDEFQLWSMNNLDKRIKDTWSTYKWPCKDIIYDFTKDAEYRDTKLKMGSLYYILLQQNAYNFIDDSMRLSRTMDSADYYNPTNDFL